MTRRRLDALSAADPLAADLPESTEDDPSAALDVEEETGLDLSEARPSESEAVIDDEESARVVQAPD